MIIILHRINTIAELVKTPYQYGVEVDVRYDNRHGRLYLNHDSGNGDDLEEYLRQFRHRFIIFNIKEAGVEQQCIDFTYQFHIPKSNYFLLDVEFPYLYRASREEGVREIAARFSEAEPIEFVLAQKGFVDWVWVDTITRLPLDKRIVPLLNGFKTCVVSPDRWKRMDDILKYRNQMQHIGFLPDAVMVGKDAVLLWES